MKRSRPSSGLATLLAFTAVLLVAACAGEQERLARPEGSALWVEPEDLERLTAEDRDALRLGEVRELFLDAARLEAGSGGVPEVRPLSAAGGDAGGSPSARLPVTLVVRGPWPGGAEPEAAATALAAGLRRLRRAAEDAGQVVAGYHFDAGLPEGEEALERLGRTLELTRREMDGGLYLSLSLAPRTLSAPGIGALVDGVDFVVPFLYGLRPDGGPGPDPDQAWTLATVDDGVGRLRDLEAPFLLGLGTVGWLQRLDAGGTPVETTRRGSLSALLSHPALGPARKAVLEVVDRQTYSFEVQRPGRYGDWRLHRGEELRVSRLSTYHLRQAAARAEADAPLLHLGELFERMPGEGEGLSVAPASLAGVALGRSAVPDLAVELEPLGGTSRFRLTLVNRGAQPTELSFLEHNFVEVRTVGGAVVRDVDPGDFRRFELETDGRRVASMVALRNADTVKLYVPLLEAGQRVESGVISLAGAGGGPVVEVTGRFVTPSGDFLHLPLRPWPAPPEPAAAEAGADTP